MRTRLDSRDARARPWLRSASAASAQVQFNPRDLSGIWQITKGHRSISANVPEMTPEGEARLDANKPTRGRFLGEPLNGQHRGFVRAVRVPSMGNDLVHQCNPNGFRALLDPEPVEFVQTQGGCFSCSSGNVTSRTVDGRTKGACGRELANRARGTATLRVNGRATPSS